MLLIRALRELKKILYSISMRRGHVNIVSVIGIPASMQMIWNGEIDSGYAKSNSFCLERLSQFI